MEILLAIALIIIGFIYSVALGLSIEFRESASRIRKLRQLKKRLKKTDDSFILENKNIVLTYNFKLNRFSFKDKAGFYIAKVSPKKFLENEDENKAYKATFDSICLFFDDKIDFEKIKDFFEIRYNVEVIKRKSNKIITSKNPSTREIVDINNASEEEIAKLPGINIVLAKKIIKYRELNNGFRSVVELFNTMNIKTPIRARLIKQIAINKLELKEETFTEEREIDF